MLITLEKIKDNGIYEFLDQYDVPYTETLDRMVHDHLAERMGGYPVYARWNQCIESYLLCSIWHNPLEPRAEFILPEI